MSITNALTWIFLFTGIVLLMLFLKDSGSKNRKVIFFGDSLTEFGINPGGYIYLMKKMLQEQGINNYHLAGAGIGGNKVYDLYLRMPGDVIAQSPDIVVIWIGINDVWHKATSATGTDADKFETFYRTIIKQLLANNIKLVLVTPTAIGERKNYSNPLDADLKTYVQTVRNLATEFNLHLCDMHALFQRYIAAYNTENLNKGILTNDGVHLNDAGNRLAAEEIWKVLKDVL